MSVLLVLMVLSLVSALGMCAAAWLSVLRPTPPPARRHYRSELRRLGSVNEILE